MKKHRKAIGPLLPQQVNLLPLLRQLAPRVAKLIPLVAAVHSVLLVDRAQHQGFAANDEKVSSPMLVDSSRMA
jgi:hypothetical protein